jgi:outer membrane protein OmpA-like peptidoglycan-associated protein
MIKEYLTIFCFLISTNIFGQDKITISNGSFEDVPRNGDKRLMLQSWTDCGPYRSFNESPPDVHPGDFWKNTVPPSEGKSYVGMVVRDNETWEGIGQRLANNLKAGYCYKFTLDMAQSENYWSNSHVNSKEINYVKPSVLRIWGGFGFCDSKELLAESSAINHNDWRKYQFKIKPKSDHKFILFEAFYKVPVLVPYCGHILIDNLSDLEEMNCDQYLVAVVNKTTGKPMVSSGKRNALPAHKKSRIPDEKPIQNQVKPAPKTDVAVNPPKNKILEDLDIKKIKTGSTIQVKSLFFIADSTTIEKSSYVVLDEILNFLKENKNVKVEIGGHTNGIPAHAYCDKISSERAKAVFDYLVSKGVPKEQLTAKGYGKRNLLTTDTTIEGRKKNQRVELKILSIG